MRGAQARLAGPWHGSGWKPSRHPCGRACCSDRVPRAVRPRAHLKVEGAVALVLEPLRRHQQAHLQRRHPRDRRRPAVQRPQPRLRARQEVVRAEGRHLHQLPLRQRRGRDAREVAGANADFRQLAQLRLRGTGRWQPRFRGPSMFDARRRVGTARVPSHWAEQARSLAGRDAAQPARRPRRRTLTPAPRPARARHPSRPKPRPGRRGAPDGPLHSPKGGGGVGISPVSSAAGKAGRRPGRGGGAVDGQCAARPSRRCVRAGRQCRRA